MQHPSANIIPKKIKRFYSYSMTPFDTQIQASNNLFQQQINPTRPSFNDNWFKKDQKQETIYNSTKHESKTNEIENKNNMTMMLKSFQNNSNEYINQQNSMMTMSLNLEMMEQNKKYLNSNFDHKTHLNNLKTMKKSLFGQKEFRKKSIQNHSLHKNVTSRNKPINQIPIKVPSFILNKKKKNQQTNGIKKTEVNNNSNHQNQRKQSFDNLIQEDQVKLGQRRIISFKKTKIIDTTENCMTNSNIKQIGVFSPPSYTKISFSKATASTLYTELQREQSVRTFKDFEQIEQIIENKANKQKNHKSLRRQSQATRKLFDQKTSEIDINQKMQEIENQINGLFSDQQQEQEQEFNQELLSQLQQLF